MLTHFRNMRMPEVTMPHLFQLNGINFVLTVLHYSIFLFCFETGSYDVALALLKHSV